MPRAVAIALLIVIVMVSSAEAQIIDDCHNVIGLFTSPSPTPETAIDLANYNGPPGQVIVYVIIINPWNEALDEPITTIGGYEFKLVMPSNVFLLSTTLPPQTTNFANTPEFLCGTRIDVHDNSAVLMTLNLGVFAQTPSLIYLSPVENVPQSLPGNLAITDFSDDFSVSAAYPSSGSFVDPVFAFWSDDYLRLIACLTPQDLRVDLPDTVWMKAAPGSSDVRTVTVENLGTGTGEMEFQLFPTAEFSIDDAVLAVTTVDSTYLRFAPTAPGTYTADLVANPTPAGQFRMITLVGESRFPGIYVATDGNDVLGDGSQFAPWQTIRHAIAAASDGDTIFLDSGTYTGDGNRDLDFGGKSIVIQSLTGIAADVVLDCEGSVTNPHRGFVFQSYEDTTSVLRNITIQNGWVGSCGGAVLVYDADHEPDQSGIATPLIDGCVFRDNHAEQAGGAVSFGVTSPYTWGPEEFHVRNCVFIGNDAPTGGALFAVDELTPSIIDCTFEENTAIRGGAMHLGWEWSYSNGVMLRCTFLRNSAIFDGGAVHVPYERVLIVTDCRFEGNRARSGGAWCVPTGYSKQSIGASAGNKNAEVFSRCVFVDNEADNYGGAIYMNNNCWLRFLECEFSGNVAGLGGGAVADLYDNNNIFSRCLFVGNQAPEGGALWLGSSYDNYLSSTYTHCTFVANEAERGSFAAGVVYSPGRWPYRFENVLVANGIGGEAFYSADGYVPGYTNSDIFGNEGGDWTGGIASLFGQNGNFSKDPLFCDPLGADYGLAANSPCAPSALHDLIGAYDVACTGIPAPVLLAVDDIPADQGYQVRLTWYRSGYDEAGSAMPILAYDVYRRVDPAAGTVRPESGAKLLGWDYLLRVPARGDQGYQVVVPTLCNAAADSTPCPSTFFVSAVTADPLVFFDSLPDSGSSIDNLAPGVPGQLAVAFAVSGNLVSWAPPQDPDVIRYDVWRTEGSPPVVALGVPTVAVTGIEWLDTEFTGRAWDQAYWVAAVDAAGNRGPLTNWSSAGVSPVGDSDLPTAFSLHDAVPNPFNPLTHLRFDLPRPSRVTLEIYDVAGRLVRRLLAGEVYVAGRHEVVWHGRDDGGQPVAAGVYLSRLRAGEQELRGRMLLVK